jgi:phosphoribosylformylglycinamidine synthase
VISDEINACTIQIEAEYDGKKEPWYLLFKNETHNHPTEIEPFGGASTCLEERSEILCPEDLSFSRR